MSEKLDKLLAQVEKLQARNKLSKTVGTDYFEPGMMEYLDKSYGSYDAEKSEIVIRFEAKGTRYDGRTEVIERVSEGDSVKIIRDEGNEFNSNNFTLTNANGRNVGNMPADLCNALAPLYDEGLAVIVDSFASFVEPLSKRSRHARQAVLFIEMKLMVNKDA